MKHQHSITVTEISMVLLDSNTPPISSADLYTPTLVLSVPSNPIYPRTPTAPQALSTSQI